MKKISSIVKNFVVMIIMALSLTVMASAATTVPASAPPTVPGCGNGFILGYYPDLEVVLAEANQNVNWDGWICYKYLPEQNPYSFILLDNRSVGHEIDPE